LYKSNPAKATLLPGRASFMLQIRTALRARVGSDSRHRQCRSQKEPLSAPAIKQVQIKRHSLLLGYVFFDE